MSRLSIRRWSAAIAVVNLLVATILFLFGGFETSVLGLPIKTHDPLHPVLFASVALTAYILTDGHQQ